MIAYPIAKSVARPVTKVSGNQKILDNLAPAAAYSFSRKLLSSYSGYAFELERNTDNEKLNVGFIGDYIDAAAVNSFCSGAVGYIRTIYDQSGNERDLQQTSLSHMIILYSSGAIHTKNGRYVAWSSDNNNYYQTGGVFTYTAITAVLVGEASTNANAFFQFGAVNTGGSVFYVNSLLYARVTTGSDCTTAFTTGGFRSIAARLTGAERQLWINNVAATAATGSQTLNQTNAVLTVVAQSTTPTYPLVGYIGDMVFFTSDLPNADRLNIVNNQMTYYGLN